MDVIIGYSIRYLVVSLRTKSTPSPPSRGSLHACTGRALEWHSRGQRFDPAYLHQKTTSSDVVFCILQLPSAAGFNLSAFALELRLAGLSRRNPAWLSGSVKQNFIPLLHIGTVCAKMGFTACVLD